MNYIIVVLYLCFLQWVCSTQQVSAFTFEKLMNLRECITYQDLPVKWVMMQSLRRQLIISSDSSVNFCQQLHHSVLNCTFSMNYVKVVMTQVLHFMLSLLQGKLRYFYEGSHQFQICSEDPDKSSWTHNTFIRLYLWFQ